MSPCGLIVIDDEADKAYSVSDAELQEILQRVDEELGLDTTRRIAETGKLLDELTPYVVAAEEAARAANPPPTTVTTNHTRT